MESKLALRFEPFEQLVWQLVDEADQPLRAPGVLIVQQRVAQREIKQAPSKRLDLCGDESVILAGGAIEQSGVGLGHAPQDNHPQ